jgi:hypothetical protein
MFRENVQVPSQSRLEFEYGIGNIAIDRALSKGARNSTRSIESARFGVGSMGRLWRCRAHQAQRHGVSAPES